MSRSEVLRKYRESHRAKIRASSRAWRERNREYIRLKARIKYREKVGASVPFEDKVLLAQLRDALNGDTCKREQVGEAAQSQTARLADVWEELNIPTPRYEGEIYHRVRLEGSYEWIAVTCRKCGKLAWTHARNGGICFDCVVHKLARDLQRWIDARLKMTDARLGKENADKTR